MPILFNKNIGSETSLSLWEMSESMDELHALNIPLPETIKNEKRKKEWICVRLLLQKIAPNTTISYNKFGAPILSDGRAISITHSKEYCCLLISPKKASVDIEPINEKAHRLKDQFISEKEEKLITQSNTSTLIWCAKECLFKLHQKGNLIFKEDLKIQTISEKTIETTLKGNSYLLNFEKFNEHYLVYYYE
ncbi:MAG: 4'-phosphopantetheinyl transferase superfamily protein [Rhodobacteraceae bacterium]|nr:4'-phosphopantetheinyl transferase superfamily protein [Paracoccaceae bacterium]